jgi:hypothetical protein
LPDPQAADDRPEHPELFISYASGDLDRAATLHRLLAAEGFRVWFDNVRLTPGCDWHKEIAAGCVSPVIRQPTDRLACEREEDSDAHIKLAEPSVCWPASPDEFREVWLDRMCAPRHQTIRGSSAFAALPSVIGGPGSDFIVARTE